MTKVLSCTTISVIALDCEKDQYEAKKQPERGQYAEKPFCEIFGTYLGVIARAGFLR